MNSKPKIEFVYFDLGNILVTFDADITCANLASLFGSTAEQANQALYESGWEDRYERGEVSDEELASQLRRELDQSSNAVSTAAILEAIGDMFQPIEPMAQTIREVLATGMRIGILSNTCSAHWDWVIRQKWPVTAGPFEQTILSYEVGSMKPDGKIYAAAEQAANVAPERLLFLDDRSENVEAAKQRGWHAVECLGGDSAVTALRNFAIME